MKKWMALIFAIVMFGGNAARAQEIAGNWQGTLQTNNGEYRIVLAVAKADTGGWTGTASVVDANGQPLHKPVPARIARDGSTIRVSITADEGGFEGKLSEDGKSIAGDYTEGDSVPMNFVRAPSVEPPGSPSPASPATRAVQDAMRASLADVSADAAPAVQPRLALGPAILSDTMGVDFSGYLQQLRKDIQRNWDPLIPQEVQPPSMKKGIVGVRFTILPDGRIGSMKLETTSGDVALDKAAWYAITSEGAFPALPKEFHGPQLDLRVGLFYNTPVPPARAGAGSPSH